MAEWNKPSNDTYKIIRELGQGAFWKDVPGVQK